MTKPVSIEAATLTSRFRVSEKDGRTQIEVHEDGEWRRILFASNDDVDELVGVLCELRDEVRQRQKGRGR